MTETPTLRQKLDGIIQSATDAYFRDHNTVSVQLTFRELQSLAEMLREDEPPDTTGVGPGSYSVTLSPPGIERFFFSVTGPGIHNRHDIPEFEREAAAESMCRCLSLAFRAGQRQRSLQLRLLLDLER